MKYEYEFSNGKTKIEISEEWAEVLIDMDRTEHNSNQTETRRHITVDTSDEQEWLSSSKMDPSYMFDEAVIRKRKEKKKKAIVDSLTREQKKLILKHCHRNVSFKEIAKKEGVSQQAISDRMAKIRKKIKKFL